MNSYDPLALSVHRACRAFKQTSTWHCIKRPGLYSWRGFCLMIYGIVHFCVCVTMLATELCSPAARCYLLHENGLDQLRCKWAFTLHEFTESSDDVRTLPCVVWTSHKACCFTNRPRLPVSCIYSHPRADRVLWRTRPVSKMHFNPNMRNYLNSTFFAVYDSLHARLELWVPWAPTYSIDLFD